MNASDSSSDPLQPEFNDDVTTHFDARKTSSCSVNPDSKSRQIQELRNHHNGETKHLKRKRTNEDHLDVIHRSDPTSFLECAQQRILATPAPLRVFLQGPSKCGKTSLAMDVAYSIASSCIATSRCPTCGLIPRKEGNEFKARTFSNKRRKRKLKSCECCAVAFLVPRQKKSELNFPLKCYRDVDTEERCRSDDVGDAIGKGKALNANADDQVEEGILLAEQRFQSQMKALDEEMEQGSSSTEFIGRTCKRTRKITWEEESLRKVKVKYMDSMSDLVLYLASIQSMPASIRPWGGIVVDDLEFYIKDQANTVISHDAGANDGATKNDVVSSPLPAADLPTAAGNSTMDTSDVMRLINILALIADTSEFLDQHRLMQGDYPKNKMKIVACINSDICSLPKHALSMVHTYIPTIATVEKRVISNAQSSYTKENLPCTISSWKVDMQNDSWNQCTLTSNERKKVMIGNKKQGITSSYDIIPWAEDLRDFEDCISLMSAHDESSTGAKEITWALP